MSDSLRHSEAAGANLALLKGAYAQWTSGGDASVEDVLDHFDDDVEMVSLLSPEVHAIGGVKRGKDQARAYFEALFRDWEMLSYADEQYFVEVGGDDIAVLARCEWRHRGTGRSVRTRKVDIWRFQDGRITRFEETLDTLAFAVAVGAVPAVAPAGT